ncbi:MAG: TonB-dependent receptor [Ignavibacteriales bacterium]|nr:TonB-dependent receptor [Ignavibacteriales bacterium]
MRNFTFFGSIYTFLAICLFICLGQSQILAQERKNPVSGNVSDSLLNTPLPGASIRMIDAKGKIITGTVSDTLGNFTLSELPVQAKILISLIGYKLVELTDTMYNGSSTRIPVKMRSVVLQTAPIIITGERPLVEYYVDKQVINIDKIPGAAGSTLVDALAKSGLVFVDPVSKTISLPGGKGVRLKVNGKSMLSIEEMIKLLPAGSVDKVEIMDTPTAKEDADGEIGVINIQLRRSLGDYLNGNVSLSASTQDFMHGDFLVNFKKDKTGIFLFTGLTQNIFVTHINSLSENRNLAAPYKNTDMARSYDESFSKFCNFGVDYDFDKMNFASVSANYFSSSSKNSYKGKTLYQYINGGGEFSIDRNSESNNNLFEYLEFTGFHKMKFENPGTELTSDILFEKIDNRNPSEIVNIYIPTLPTPSSNMKTTGCILNFL